MKIKCTRIEYEPDEAFEGVSSPTRLTVDVSDDIMEILDDRDEQIETLEEEIEARTGRTVRRFKAGFPAERKR